MTAGEAVMTMVPPMGLGAAARDVSHAPTRSITSGGLEYFLICKYSTYIDLRAALLPRSSLPGTMGCRIDKHIHLLEQYNFLLILNGMKLLTT